MFIIGSWSSVLILCHESLPRDYFSVYGRLAKYKLVKILRWKLTM